MGRYHFLPLKMVFMILVVMLGMALPGFPKTLAKSDGTEIEAEIKQVVHMQSEAVNKGDWEQFKRLLWKSDRTYIQERKRWFEDAVSYIDRGTFHMEVESIAPYKPGLLQVWIHQSYEQEGVRHTVRFPLIYQQTAGGWKDSDLSFYTMSRENVIVKYTDKRLSEQASVALDVVEKSLEAFKKRLDWEPDKAIQIKLYHQKEMFRQSVKLSLPNWAAGWNERGQAIKFVGSVNSTDSDTFASGIVHEITHRVISDLSHDNAAYWMQEGLAEYYQRHLLPGLRLQGSDPLRKPHWTFEKLERLNLETLPAEEARLYYLHSYDMVRLFMKEYGEEELKEWCEALKMYPDIDEESAAKIPELNTRTREAFEKATRQPFKSFVNDWFSQYEHLKSMYEFKKRQSYKFPLAI